MSVREYGIRKWKSSRLPWIQIGQSLSETETNSNDQNPKGLNEEVIIHGDSALGGFEFRISDFKPGELDFTRKLDISVRVLNSEGFKYPFYRSPEHGEGV